MDATWAWAWVGAAALRAGAVAAAAPSWAPEGLVSARRLPNRPLRARRSAGLLSLNRKRLLGFANMATALQRRISVGGVA